METLILGWYVLVATGSVRLLVLVGALRFLGALVAPRVGVAGDRLGHRNLLCITRAIHAVLAAALMLFAFTRTLPPLHVFVIAGLAGLIRPSDMMMRNRVRVGATATAVTAASAAGGAEMPWSAWGDLRHGLAYVRRKPELMAALSVAFLINVFAIPSCFGVLPYVARRSMASASQGWARWWPASALSAPSWAGGAQCEPVSAATCAHDARGHRRLVHPDDSLCLHPEHHRRRRRATLTGLAQSLCVTPLAAVMLRVTSDEFRGRV
ncbi:MAG: hypothetical protein IPI73_23190, partial [Betaproteobacteria bacterium]|nr:hypothetical protein [Betaproteobacteria bacterium]